MPEPTLAVAGTGKLARNVGLHFFRRGWRVAWLSRSGERAQAARPELAKLVRRLRLVDPALPGDEAWAVAPVGACPWTADLVVESSVEDRAAKRALAAALEAVAPASAPRLTNSSSILPSDVGPAWLGCHFFYPVELSGFVELIVPGNCDAAPARALLAGAGLRAVEQSEAGAFAFNRLLLPLQAAALADLAAGCDPALVEAASATPWTAAGALSTMDGIGLGLVAAAAANYGARARRAGEAEAAATVAGLLGRVLAADAPAGGGGVREPAGAGRPDRPRLLGGRVLPWAVDPARRPDPAAYAAALRRGAAALLSAGDLAEDDLAYAVDSYFGGSYAAMPARGEA